MKKIIHHIKLAIKNIANPELIAGGIIAVTVVIVTINTSTVIMQNYTLERDVRVAEQKVAIALAELETQKLKNNYFRSDAFLDIASRKQLSKGLAGEKLIIVPKSVALSYIPADSTKTSVSSDAQTKPNSTSIQKWLKFISGNLD